MGETSGHWRTPLNGRTLDKPEHAVIRQREPHPAELIAGHDLDSAELEATAELADGVPVTTRTVAALGHIPAAKRCYANGPERP